VCVCVCVRCVCVCVGAGVGVGVSMCIGGVVRWLYLRAPMLSVRVCAGVCVCLCT